MNSKKLKKWPVAIRNGLGIVIFFSLLFLQSFVDIFIADISIKRYDYPIYYLYLGAFLMILSFIYCSKRILKPKLRYLPEAFLQPNLSFLKVGYKFHQKKRTAFNAAMAYTLKNAIIGTSPDFEVDYAAAMLSRGNLTGASAGAAAVSGTNVVFSWDDNSAEVSARPDDKAMLLVYNPAKRESIAVLDLDIRRDAGTATVTPPDSYAGQDLHFYIAFQAADGSVVSDSQYLGMGVIV